MPATVVVPFRPGKTRLALPEARRAELQAAMLADVQAACAGVGPVVVTGIGGGLDAAIAAALAELEGPVVIVNADVPCVATADVEALLAAAPALVAARDGTTNALALKAARDFVPLYGPGSAGRFERVLGARRLELPNLADDVDSLADLERIEGRVGTQTRAALAVLRVGAPR